MAFLGQIDVIGLMHQINDNPASNEC